MCLFWEFIPFFCGHRLCIRSTFFVSHRSRIQELLTHLFFFILILYCFTSTYWCWPFPKFCTDFTEGQIYCGFCACCDAFCSKHTCCICQADAQGWSGCLAYRLCECLWGAAFSSLPPHIFRWIHWGHAVHDCQFCGENSLPLKKRQKPSSGQL